MSHQTIVIREEDTTLIIEQVTVPSRISSKITLPVGGDPFTFCDENGGLLLTIDKDGNIISEKGFFELSGQAAPALSPAGKMRLYFDSGINKLLLSENGGAYADIMDGSGNVVGPASATDNALVRFNATTGKLIQNSLVTVDDLGNLSANATVGPHLIGNFRINLDIIARVGGGQIDFGNGSPFEFTSDESDSASAVAFDFNILTGGGLSTAGAKLVTVRNNNVEKLSIDKDGNVVTLGGVTATGNIESLSGFMRVGGLLMGNVAGQISSSVTTASSIQVQNATTNNLFSNVADSASAVGWVINNSTTLSTVGAKLLSVKNNTVEKLFIDKDGLAQWTSSAAEISIGGISNILVYRAVSGHDFRTDTGGGSSGIVFFSQAIGTFYRGTAGSAFFLLGSGLGAVDADVEWLRFGPDNTVFNLVRGQPFIMTGTHFMLNKIDAIEVDAQLEDSRILRFRAAYDSDPTGGFTAADFDAVVQHIMLTGGATPTSQLDFLVNGANRLSLPSVAPPTYTRNATIVTDRTLLASASATVTNNNNVLAALIEDLQARNLIN